MRLQVPVYGPHHISGLNGARGVDLEDMRLHQVRCFPMSNRSHPRPLSLVQRGSFHRCIWFVCTLTHALLTKPPRACLHTMEWSMMIAVGGIGVFMAIACYFMLIDNKAVMTTGFWFGEALKIIFTFVIGFSCVTGAPRAGGKWLLKALHEWVEKGTSFEHQVLAATIAIMVLSPPWSVKFYSENAVSIAAQIGSDSDHHVAIQRALRDLRCVSLADVTWEDFSEGKPNPRCYKLSRPAEFKAVDWFISHSWSDDPKAKWRALQEMRAAFVAQHDREPLVWFDKYCIDVSPRTDAQPC